VEKIEADRENGCENQKCGRVLKGKNKQLDCWLWSVVSSSTSKTTKGSVRAFIIAVAVMQVPVVRTALLTIDYRYLPYRVAESVNDNIDYTNCIGYASPYNDQGGLDPWDALSKAGTGPMSWVSLGALTITAHSVSNGRSMPTRNDIFIVFRESFLRHWEA
jgi:hypothetical protein